MRERERATAGGLLLPYSVAAAWAKCAGGVRAVERKGLRVRAIAFNVYKLYVILGIWCSVYGQFSFFFL